MKLETSNDKIIRRSWDKVIKNKQSNKTDKKQRNEHYY